MEPEMQQMRTFPSLCDLLRGKAHEKVDMTVWTMDDLSLIDEIIDPEINEPDLEADAHVNIFDQEQDDDNSYVIIEQDLDL